MYFPWKSHGESRGKFMVSPRSNPRIQQMRLPKGGILSQSLHSGGQVDPSGVACTVLVKKNVEKYVKYSDSICSLYI